MRIGIFTEVYYPYVSGVVTSIDALKKGLEKKGHEVFIITINENSLVRRYVKNKNVIKIRGIPSGVYDYNIKVVYPIKVIKIIRDLDLDIIHSQTEFGIGRFGKSMSKRLNIPFVQTAHTIYDEDVMGTVTKGYFNSQAEKLFSIFLKRFYEKDIYNFIVPSDKTKKILKEKFKIKKSIKVIPNGIDLSVFDFEKIQKSKIINLKNKFNIKEDEFVVLYLGRLAEEKNIRFLINCQREINEKNLKIKLLIVGTGPAEKNFKKLVNESQLKDNCIFAGRVPHDETKFYYALADVMVTASHSETQGLTLIEALATKTPVLAIEDDSFRDVIKNNVNGYLFSNESEYIKLILKLSNDEKLMQKFIDNSLKSISRYTMESFAESVLKIYNKEIREHEKR